MSMAELLNITTEGEGLPIVLIHGWGLNSAVWQPTMAALSSTVKVINISLPGYGDNIDHSLAPYNLAQVSQLIVNTVQQPAIYLGWSLGGLVATNIALSFPEKVLGLITVASSPSFVEEDLWPGINAAVLANFHRQLAQNAEKTIKNFLKIQAMGSPHIRDDIKNLSQLVMQYPTPTQQTLDQSLMLLEQVDLRECLKEIHLPFLRLYGKLDGLVPRKVLPLIDKLAPLSEVHIFSEASHAPFISEPNEFIEVLKQWLQKIPLAG